MKRALFSLHSRLALAFGALMAIVVGAALLLWMWSSNNYERDLRQQLNLDVARHLVEHSVPLTPEGADEKEFQGMLMHIMSVNPALEVYLLDNSGRILAFDAPEGHVKLESVTLEPIRGLLAGDELPVLGDDPRSPGTLSPFSVWPVEVDGEAMGFVYVVVGGELWRSTSGPLRGSNRRLVLMTAGLALLAVGVLASVFLARRLTRPLRELSLAMSEGRGSLPADLQDPQDELGVLARTYVRMARRIREQVERLERVDRNRREFVASVSHDLRTPLASLQGYLELLEEREDLDDDSRREYLGIARRRTRHLTHLVNQLFELAKLEAGDVRADPEPFNLGELTQDVLQGMRQQASRRRIRLVCSMPRVLPDVNGDLGLLERAVSNLVENALKYTPEGGEVRVRLEDQSERVEWSVHDGGPGIPEAELPHIFERRFRGSGRRLAPGTGLGLAITRRVLELHGSAVQVESGEGVGCVFRFGLKVA